MKNLIITEPIMCRDERMKPFGPICFIVGFWISIDNTHISISIDELTKLSEVCAEITHDEGFKEAMYRINENPQFIIESNNRCNLTYNGDFSCIHFRSSVIKTILRMLNIDSDCTSISDINISWTSINDFINNEAQLKDQKQTDLYVETVNYYRRLMVERFLQKFLPQDKVDSVMIGESECKIFLEPSGWIQVSTSNTN